MSYEAMLACADMTVANAIEDLAQEENISIDEARNMILESETYKSLYDIETGMWKEGPDYLRDTFRREVAGKASENERIWRTIDEKNV